MYVIKPALFQAVSPVLCSEFEVQQAEIWVCQSFLS